MWVAAAMLGPVCDGRHSSHDVLHYARDSIAGAPWLLHAPGSDQILLETCWWVPVAFGGAGLILGVAHPLLDEAWSDGPRQPPGWPTVLVAVAAFVATYDLSGQLAQAAAATGGSHDYLGVDLPLAACAAATFFVFERSPGGLFMMFLLATIGPVVEIGLINQLGVCACASLAAASDRYVVSDLPRLTQLLFRACVCCFSSTRIPTPILPASPAGFRGCMQQADPLTARWGGRSSSSWTRVVMPDAPPNPCSPES